jgi:glycosyltransferase involved in cell wall biosynthesis
MLIAPPWPHEAHVEPLRHEENRFRVEHGLADEFVIMYSGNHSPSHPLRTLLDAALRLRDNPRLKFLFVGGGLGKREVEAFAAEHKLQSIQSLPYQPLADLRFSLSAADVHIVSLGDNMVGIVHPCKIYGAMTVGRPILFLGPRPSHIADILDQHDIGRQISHGDVNAAVKAIEFFLTAPPQQLAAMGETAQRVLGERFTQAALCTQFCDALERSLRLEAAAAPARDTPVIAPHAGIPSAPDTR